MKRKNLSGILSTMIDRVLIETHELNDFSPGSILRTIFEAVALEIEMYYTLSKQNIEKGIETGVYEGFDFERREAQKAYGDVIIEFHTAMVEPVVLPRGTKFFSNFSGQEQVYETLQDYRVPAGESRIVVEVFSTTPGTSGNVSRGVINTTSSSAYNISRVYNPSDITTGQNREPLENVKQRFREFVETRGRATSRAISYGVRQVESISGVYVDSQVGRIVVYAHDRNGNLNDRLKRDVEAAVEDYRPSGILLEVEPIDRVAIDIDIEVNLSDKSGKTEAFRQEIEEAVKSYLNSKEVSENLIRTKLIQRIRNIDDYLIYDIKVNNPEENVMLENNQLIRAGNISVRLT